MENTANLIGNEIADLKSKIAISPNNCEVLFELAKHMDKEKKYFEAEEYLKQIAKIDSRNAEIQMYLGKACMMQNKFHDAVLWYANSLEINPFAANTYMNISDAYIATKNYDKAIYNLEKFLELSNNDADKLKCYNDLGMIYLNQGHSDKAIACFSTGLAIKPNDEFLILNLSTAYTNKGDLINAEKTLLTFPPNSVFEYLRYIHQSTIFKISGKIDEAIQFLEDGIKNIPSQAHILYSKLGELLQSTENYEKAENCFIYALAANPNEWTTLVNLAYLTIQRKDFTAAKKYIEQLFVIKPDYSYAYVLLAITCIHENNLEGALHCVDTAIFIDQFEMQAYMLKAEICLKKYFESGYSDKNLETTAINAYLKALELFPNNVVVASRITSIRKMHSEDLEFKIISASLQRLFNEYDNLANKITDPLYFTREEAIAVTNYCSTCASTLTWDKLNYAKPILEKIILDQLEEQQRCCVPVFLSHHLFPDIKMQHRLAIEYSKFFNADNPYNSYHMPGSEKLRIGYISPDFNDHVVGFLIDKMFSYHDRSKFEIYAYSIREKNDEQRKVIIASVDHFRELTEVSNKHAAEIIHNDKIDILIDLAGYTTGCRPEILGFQPAPVQAHFLGELGTMGASFIQYHLATPVQVPESHLPYYTEQIVYLPETIVAIKQHDLPERFPTRKEFGLPEDKIVFCSFNNHYRINEGTFKAWMHILQTVSNSVLWLSANSMTNIQQLRKLAKAYNIDPERLIFKAKSILNEDWHPILADIYLDTFVISGCTTSILSLWVCLPILTLAGDTPHSRIGASLIHEIGTPELIASSADEYCEIAIDLATNPEKLALIKNKILTNKKQNSLFNQQRLIKHLENAYLLMHEDYKTGKKSKTIKVPKLTC